MPWGVRAASSAGVSQSCPTEARASQLPAHVALNLEWIDRGFRMKGRDQPAMAGKSGAPRRLLSLRLLPRPASLCTNVNE